LNFDLAGNAQMPVSTACGDRGDFARVAVIADALKGVHRPEFTGGAEAYLDRFIQSLLPDHEILFITRREGARQARLYGQEVHFIETLPARMGSEWLHSLMRNYIPWEPLSLVQSKALLRAWRPAAVYFSNFRHLSFGPLLAARALRIPSYKWVYDYWSFCLRGNLSPQPGQACGYRTARECYQSCEPNNPARLWLNHARRLVCGKLDRKFDYYLALSDDSRQRLIQWGIPAKRIQLRAEELDLAAFEKARRVRGPRPPVVLFSSPSWGGHKGTALLPGIAQRVLAQIPQARFLVSSLGREAILAELRREIECRGLVGSFEFFGAQDAQGMERIFDRAAVLLLPEMWPNMCPSLILEGMRMGLPVLASDMGGMPEFTPFVAPPTEQGMARGLLNILQRQESVEPADFLPPAGSV
jgi:glycosyltransferase involved in cell wall biosynthesis